MIKKIFIFILICSIIICFPFGGISAPVHVPGRPLLNVQNNLQYPANVAIEGDFVTGRKLQEDICITRANWATLKITEIFMDNRVQPYFLLGTLIDGEFKQEINGMDIEYKTDDAFTWGVGTTVLAYEITDRLGLGLDVKYRQVNPIVGSVEIDGNSFSRGDDNVSLDCDYQEWQVALGLCGLTEHFLGYGGIKYSDVKALLKAEAGGIDTKETVSSAEKIGVFVGCEFLLTENATIGLEGRFIDEEAYTCFVTIHF
jgi:opacity protein-like surface antigen